MKLGEIGLVVSDEKLFNNMMNFYMYTGQAQGKITLAENNFNCNLKLLLLQLYFESFKQFSYFCHCVFVHVSQWSFV